MKRTYKINLWGIDTRDYEKNPIVLLEHNYNGLPLGKATIHKYKHKVTVEYLDKVPFWEHDIGTSLISENYGRDKLVELSVIPVLRST